MCDSQGTCGTCGSGPGGLRASVKLLKYQIATQGYGVSFVFDEVPCFAYTVGLEETLQHPELIVVGLDYEMSQRTLADLIGRVRGEERLEAGESLHLAGGSAVLLVAVPHSSARNRLGAAEEYYGGRPFRALQVLWPDEEGHFPTEEACSERVRARQALFSQSA